ncbi:hypothetical protein RND81_07G143900 [Saponaria officinalis]|uniref:Transmembrane protein n=1 Tax=Saponaria officinalis TaxID=3572 RepID=A0AAW1JUM4_SAPOF
MMGFGWMNRNECKKQCRSLFWRIKAAVKKTVKCHSNKSKKQVKFHYDPSSYALNFDDGGGGSGGFMASIGGGLRKEEAFMNGDDQKIIGYYYKLQFCILLAANSTLVYVFLVKL